MTYGEHQFAARGAPDVAMARLSRGSRSDEQVPCVRAEPSVHSWGGGPAVARMGWKCGVAYVHILQQNCRMWWFAAVPHMC